MKTIVLVFIAGAAIITYASEAKCQNAGTSHAADTPSDQAKETTGDPQIASLQDLTNEALQRSPMLVSARKHWEAPRDKHDEGKRTLQLKLILLFCSISNDKLRELLA